ncbi:MAG: DTW domain-containing protein [Polyangiaceae bacterium]|nr:DTW domain-containing protein [Polyangiaceae bacterium]
MLTEAPSSPESAVPRDECYRCFKPRQVCICGALQSVDNRTEITIVQHPRERAHPLGTARIAELGLSNCQLYIPYKNHHKEHVPSFAPGTAILYPSSNAVSLESLAPEDHPRHLVVLDGTWHHAKTLYRDHAWLQSLPCVRLSPSTPSEYRIRREPNELAVSTIESIVHALRIIEPDTANLESLLEGFRAMIDTQIEYIERGDTTPRERTRRPAPWRRLPKGLVEYFERLVVVYAESTSGRDHAPRCPTPRPQDDPADRDLVYVAAVRIATGECFERFVQPARHQPRESHLGHMGFVESDFRSALPRAELVNEWTRFRAPDDIISAWNQSSLDFVAALHTDRPTTVLLKAAFGSVTGAGQGSLEVIMNRLRLPLQLRNFRGRARQRMGNAECLARYMNRLSQGDGTPPPCLL